MIDFKMIILFLLLEFFLILLALQIHRLIQCWKIKRDIRLLLQDDFNEDDSEDGIKIIYDEEQSEDK